MGIYALCAKNEYVLAVRSLSASTLRLTSNRT